MARFKKCVNPHLNSVMLCFRKLLTSELNETQQISLKLVFSTVNIVDFKKFQ